HFFGKAEDGIRGFHVTGVQTCALPIFAAVAAALLGPVIGVLTGRHPLRRSWMVLVLGGAVALAWAAVLLYPGPSPRWLLVVLVRSEERRVGKERSSRWAA